MMSPICGDVVIVVIFLDEFDSDVCILFVIFSSLSSQIELTLDFKNPKFGDKNVR